MGRSSSRAPASSRRRHGPTLTRSIPTTMVPSMHSATLRRIATWSAIWFAVASIFISQNISRYLVRGQPVDWFQAVVIELLYWVPWLALTPLLIYAVTHFPLGAGRTR